MEYKYLKITKNNIEYSYRILATFSSSKTKNNYIVYTDDKKGEDNKINMYASKYDLNNLNKLYDLETEEEWNEVERVFETVINNKYN